MAVRMKLLADVSDPGARDIAVFQGGILVLAKRFRVLQKEQTSVVTTVNDTGDKIVPSVLIPVRNNQKA
jgi:hypothetical protein